MNCAASCTPASRGRRGGVGAAPELAPAPAPALARRLPLLLERLGMSVQRPTTAEPGPRARLLAPVSSSSSGGQGTCANG